MVLTPDGALQLLLFILPAYVANATPVLLGGGMPVDFGRRAWDGRRLLGDGKTWRGLFSGLLAGILVGALEAGLLGDPRFYALGMLLSLGAMLGDLFGSFVKRRLGFVRGHPFFLMDQLPFMLFALALASPLFLPSPEGIVFLAIVTYILHISTNMLANKLGLKPVPW